MSTMTMKIAAFALTFTLALVSTSDVSAAADPGPGAAIAVAGVAMATVQDIDQKSRKVTLRDPEGNLTTFTAGPQVRNLAQVEKGDVVLMEYYEGFAIQLEPKGDGGEARVDDLDIKMAARGEKPGAVVTETVDVVAVVKAVDKKKRTVTLEGVEATVVLGVAEDIDLDKVRVGDRVEAKYVSEFAVAVEPSPEVSGTVQIESKTIALGVGVTWGHGTLTMYDGSTHAFKVDGMSVADLGISKATLSGNVYHLTDPKDFAGVYVAAAAGATLGKGASAIALRNANGVVMTVKSKEEGARVTLASEGMKVELVD